MTDLDVGRLRSQCADEANELLLRGIQQFNEHHFFEQHETLETAWRNESGPIRLLYQGILQVGVAYYHIQHHNYVGALKVLDRACAHLKLVPEVCCNVDVVALIKDAQAVQAELLRLGPKRIAEFNPVFFKPVTLINGLR